MRRLDISEQIELAPTGKKYVPVSNPITGELQYIPVEELDLTDENIDWLQPLLDNATIQVEGQAPPQ